VSCLCSLAGIAVARQLPTARAPYFLLGLDSQGVWIICETAGGRAGLARTCEAAIKVARDESLDGNFTILYQPEALGWRSRGHIGRAA